MRGFFAAALLLLSPAVLVAADTLPYPQWDGKETVAAYAKRTGLEATLTLDLGAGVKWEGVLVPAGSFLMGSPPGEAKTKEEAAAEKQRKVTISQPFYMGKFELTQKQYEAIMGANPSPTKGDDLPASNFPVKDAETFCQKMSEKTGRAVKLPTEAQWEYACRAGTTTAYCNGDTIQDMEQVCWYGANSGGKPHAVGQKAPNHWGIYDMHGNIREYVRDLYKAEAQGDATDPTGPQQGDPANHVVRGGAFTANAATAGNCRSGSRRPTEALPSNGFRVMVELGEKK